jgi:hypothetical protein
MMATNNHEHVEEATMATKNDKEYAGKDNHSNKNGHDAKFLVLYEV